MKNILGLIILCTAGAANASTFICSQVAYSDGRKAAVETTVKISGSDLMMKVAGSTLSFDNFDGSTAYIDQFLLKKANNFFVLAQYENNVEELTGNEKPKSTTAFGDCELQ